MIFSLKRQKCAKEEYFEEYYVEGIADMSYVGDDCWMWKERR